MKILGLVSARGGSKGIPRKNIAPLAGKPLIEWTIMAALESQVLHHVVVSTEDDEIAETAKRFGAEVPFKRPRELARDDTPGIAPVLHAIEWLEEHEHFKPDFVLLLQPTSPLRTAEDIRAAVRLAKRKKADSVVSMSSIRPHFAWAKDLAADGRVRTTRRLPRSVKPRQALRHTFAPNGAIYLTRRDWLLRRKSFYPPRTYALLMPAERSIDIDTPWDLHLAELVLHNRRADFAKEFDLAGCKIGSGHPCFIIAEAGVNHNGDIEIAKRLIDAASAAGASAVKFQTFRAERLARASAPKAEYQLRTTPAEESQFDMLKKLELNAHAHEVLMAHAQRRGILFLSTPFDRESVDLLDRLGIPAFKIGSGEITNWPLLRQAASKGKPVLLSTGMSDLAEVREAVRTVQAAGCSQLALFHCVSNYPADPADADLRAIGAMADAFRMPVGFSDHTMGVEVSKLAVAAGASLIEKHLTLDRGLPGPDHPASLDPGEFKTLVREIRSVEQVLGDGVKKPAASEADVRSVARRSLVSLIDLQAGDVIKADMLDVLRPADGIPPNRIDGVIGRKTRRNLAAGQIIAWKDLE